MLYQRGKRKEAMALDDRARALVGMKPRGPNALERIARSVVTSRMSPIAAAPEVGKEFAQSFNPVTLYKTAKHNVTHPLSGGGPNAINAGVIVGGPGGIGRLSVERPLELKVSPKTIAATPEETRIVTKNTSEGPVAEIARTPEAELVRAMAPARRAAKEKAKAITEQKSERLQRAVAARDAAPDPQEGLRAFNRELKGAYDTADFQALREGTLSRDDVAHLIRVAREHPDLTDFQSHRVGLAIEKAWSEGRAPQPNEIKLILRAFGPSEAREMNLMSRLRKLTAFGGDLINIPRAFESTLDISFGGRQGLMAAVGHPRVFFPLWRRQFGKVFSEKEYEAGLKALHEHPEFERAAEAGVRFSELAPTGSMRLREEQFPSQMAENLNVPIGGGRSIGPGKVVRGAGRGFTWLADANRLHIWTDINRRYAKRGGNVEDPAFQQALASYVNNATGRGGLWKLEPGAPMLNTFLFSPRLAASRIAFLNPLWYAWLATKNPYVATIAARSMIKLVGSGALVLYGGHKLLGATIGTDPRNADFAKLRFGETRIDIFAGFQQYVRLVSQMKTGKVVSSTSGKEITLGPGIGHLTKHDIFLRFWEGKASPPASVVIDYWKGTDFEGKPFSWKKETYAKLVPLVAQDTWDMYHHTGSVPFASLNYALSAMGIGTQTYGAPTKKPKEPTNPYLKPSESKSGGSNPFLPGGSGESQSSSNPFLP